MTDRSDSEQTIEELRSHLTYWMQATHKLQLQVERLREEEKDYVTNMRTGERLEVVAGSLGNWTFDDGSDTPSTFCPVCRRGSKEIAETRSMVAEIGRLARRNEALEDSNENLQYIAECREKEAEKLRETLDEALAYVPEYFVEKHELDKQNPFSRRRFQATPEEGLDHP